MYGLAPEMVHDFVGRFFYAPSMNKVKDFFPRVNMSFFELPKSHALQDARDYFWTWFSGRRHMWERCGVLPTGYNAHAGTESGTVTLANKDTNRMNADTDQNQNQSEDLNLHFASKYAIIFHPHRSLNLGRFVMRLDGDNRPIRLDKNNLSLLTLHHLLRLREDGARCPPEVCGSYRPRIFDYESF